MYIVFKSYSKSAIIKVNIRQNPYLSYQGDDLLIMKKNEILKTLMNQKNITTADISKSTGIPYTTLKSILDNSVEKSSYRYVSSICRYLGITTDELEELAASDELSLPRKLLFEISDFSESELQQLQHYISYIRFLRNFEKTV